MELIVCQHSIHDPETLKAAFTRVCFMTNFYGAFKHCDLIKPYGTVVAEPKYNTCYNS